jgi:hypothetical protein
MTSKDWFIKIIKVAGVNFPGAASLVQILGEIDSAAMAAKLEKLCDPISFLHENVPEAARIIYENLKTNDSFQLNFPKEFYIKFSKPLAVLTSSGLISKDLSLGAEIPHAILLIDASFIMYICSLKEDSNKMQEIIDLVDQCEKGSYLDGNMLSNSIGLPVCVIRAVFEIYEKKGFGNLSKAVNSCNYKSVV